MPPTRPLRIKLFKMLHNIRDQGDTMSDSSATTTQQHSPLPPDDPTRNLVVTKADDSNLPHIGLVGDTYTTLLTGKDTAGRFCLIDMHIPPGGGPPPHRHDFEETFIILEGQIEATFRGAKSVASAGQTVHIPANAPSVSKQERPPGAPVMHLLSCRTRRLLRPGRRARRNPHDRAPKTRRESPSGLSSKS